MSRKLTFYTDGAFSSKTEMGGWACLCLEEEQIIFENTGYEPYSTNNRCELFGILCALEYTDQLFGEDIKVDICTDSAYVSNCFNQKWYKKWLANGWKTSDKQEVKNQDLWGRIIALYIKLKDKFNLNFVLVKGHSDNKWNKLADTMAVKARKVLED